MNCLNENNYNGIPMGFGFQIENIGYYNTIPHGIGSNEQFMNIRSSCSH